MNLLFMLFLDTANILCLETRLPTDEGGSTLGESDAQYWASKVKGQASAFVFVFLAPIFSLM